MIEYLRTITAAALDIHTDEIDLDGACSYPQQLFELIRPLVMSDLGLSLYDYDLPFCTSLRLLAEHLVRELEPAPVPAAPMGELYEEGAWAWGLSTERFHHLQVER